MASHQQSLFPGGSAEVLETPAGVVRLARVIVAEPVGPLDYRVPDALAEVVRPGVPLRVPLGKRRTMAYVKSVSVAEAPEGIRLRDIEGVDPERPELPASLIDLIGFAADYYMVPPGEMLAAAVPTVKRRASIKYAISESGRRVIGGKLHESDRAVLALAERFPTGFTVAAIERELGWTRRRGAGRLRKLTERGWLEPTHQRRGPRMSHAYRRLPVEVGDRLSPRQTGVRALLEALPADGAVLASELSRAHRGVYRKLKTLEAAGLVERTLEEVRVRPGDEPELGETIHEPTMAQADAIAAITEQIDGGAFGSFLLQGVTGSGKTEVYLRVIAHALGLGKKALVLVPEIALTPQLGARFRARFGDQVATFHSGLTTAERRDEWERVATGEATIGLGARSAIFLPLDDLGVIIVDEEHETSFKQEEMPRYNARDLAVYRARQHDAVVILGSATPSLETKSNAGAGRYEPLLLPDRVASRPMPEVEIVDLATADRVGEGLLTESLAKGIERVLHQDEQAILFLNRRGFAPYVFCRDCGHAFRCDDCDVALTLHRRRGALSCHYCGYEETVPELCPGCDSMRLDATGLGTEKLEGELRSLFGDVPTARLDRDTVRKRSDLNLQLTRFRKGEARILLGTQMVTKGHDFPGVTLVGVVSADGSLNFPDFRASERTFQLLSQVAGRAGRGERPGKVLIQAYDTDHYAVRRAAAHDYEGFVARELEAREELGYPPFTHLVLLRFEGELEGATREEARQQAELLKLAAESEPVTVLGPATAPLARLKGSWRIQVLLKGASRPALRRVLAALPPTRRSQTRRILDVDPFTML